MTIAMCYVSPEGVVLGADSTASVVGPTGGGNHYFNHGQKVFELGEDGTVGVLIWGLGGLTTLSHRTLLAQLADKLKSRPAKSVAEIMDRWISQFWRAYSADAAVAECKALGAKQSFDPNANPPDPNARTDPEEKRFDGLKRNLVAGFCISGYVPRDRTPVAYFVHFEPLAAAAPKASQITHTAGFWGAPNMIQRLIFGVDAGVAGAIRASGHWKGSDQDLVAILGQFTLSHAVLPIRDAIDFVHACIYSTIKALKFSMLDQICGGPIEIAVITTDRRFRWVRHKEWDVAIRDGG